MGITEYAFVTYVFILLCFGIWLYGKFIHATHRKSSKKQGGDYEKEQRLFKLYQNIEDMLASFEEFADEARADIELKKSEIKEMLDETKHISKTAQNVESTDVFLKSSVSETLPEVTAANAAALAAYKAAANIKMVAEAALETPEEKADINEKVADNDKEQGTEKNSVVANGLSSLERVQLKIPDKVAEMSAKGIDINDIAKQLNISVREVALAMKIKKVQ